LTILRLLGWQLAIAIWVCLFRWKLGFLNSPYLLTTLGRIAIESIVLAILIDSLFRRFSDNSQTTTTLILGVCFLIPLLSHFLPTDSPISTVVFCVILVGTGLLQIAMILRETTSQDIRALVVCLSFANVIYATEAGLTLFAFRLWLDKLVQFSPIVIALYHSCIIFCVLSIQVRSVMTNQFRIVQLKAMNFTKLNFMTILIGLHSILWWGTKGGI
jgi:hypothetical protein